MEEANGDKKEKLLLIFFTLGAGVIFNYLFYEKEPGISYPIYALVLLGLFWWGARRFISVKKSFGWLILIPTLLLAATFAVHSNPVLLVLNFLLVPVLLVVHTILAANGSVSWADFSIISQSVRRVIPQAFENVPQLFIFITKHIKPREDGSSMPTLKKIAVGLLICVPVLLIVLPLLSGADMVFNHYLNNFYRIWENFDLEPAVRQGLIILLVFLYLYGYIWSFHASPPQAETGKPAARGFLDPVTLLTVLIVLNLVYLLFSIVQISYLYGGYGHSLPAGFTYSEYARRGFFELVAVTIINLSILLGSIHFAAKKSRSADKAIRFCLSLLVLFSLNMLFSAHFKMSLYEEAQGLTYLRVFVHYFIALLFILLMIALGRAWSEKVPLVKSYIVIALAFYTVLNFINVDRIIARSNIESYARSGEIDVNYLQELSWDAIPEMIPLAEAEDPEIARQVREYLLLEKQYLSKDQPWQSFNYSHHKAKAALEKAADENIFIGPQ